MEAQDFIDKYSYYPLHKTHLKTDKLFKFFPKGLVCYEETSAAFVVAGDPVCKNKTDIPKVLDEFVAWAKTQDKLVCGYYFSEYVAHKSKSLLPYYAGVTLGSDLTKVKVKGAEAKDIRRSLNYGKRRELEFSELTRSKYFELFYELKNLETAWFNHKSTYKKIKFLLSSIKLDNKKISDRHFVVRNKKNKVVAYISLDKFKEPNKQFSFYVDHMFRDPKNYSLAMDFLIVQIIMKLKKEGHRYLDLGFCPFHKVKPKSIIESGLYLSSRIKYLYNSKGVYKYKNKFANYDKPGFLLIDPDYSKIKQCFALGKVTFQ